MLRMYPEGLTNEIIQKIGKDYLNQFGEEPSLFHANHPIAKMLRAYDKESTIEDKWHFLANTYAQLRENNWSFSALGMSIFKLAAQAFQQPNLSESQAVNARRMRKAIKIYFMAKEVEELKATVSLLTKNQK